MGRGVGGWVNLGEVHGARVKLAACVEALVVHHPLQLAHEQRELSVARRLVRQLLDPIHLFEGGGDN